MEENVLESFLKNVESLHLLSKITPPYHGVLVDSQNK